MSERPLRLLIAEDVELVAEAFEALLSTEPAFTVVARVGRGDQVLPAVQRHRPDVALLDVDMPGATGIEAARLVTDAHPECRVILLTALPGSGHLHRALTAGASGYLVKATTGARLIDAIKNVAAGTIVIDPQLAADALRSGPNVLSAREQEILRLVDRGLSSRAIAAELFLSHGTVRNYLSTVMSKLDARSRVEAVRIAHRRGWL
ncbi:MULTISPECIES: response regulator transcription factor [Catenuloplanes]|uniref:Two-component system response regulator DesR n=1 Tax=Catenuloplanes niger TaxID=587534 RepID=A0AAE4CUP9_9ACTN|nr:response regulator transcription factor [Catenuloplanes niger]MDR7326621.1 two-component system response regulator DesR [Catenuloplanes niger]